MSRWGTTRRSGSGKSGASKSRYARRPPCLLFLLGRCSLTLLPPFLPHLTVLPQRPFHTFIGMSRRRSRTTTARSRLATPGSSNARSRPPPLRPSSFHACNPVGFVVLPTRSILRNSRDSLSIVRPSSHMRAKEEMGRKKKRKKRFALFVRNEEEG